MRINIRARHHDVTAWALISVVIVAGVYACFLFESIVGGLASAILKIFF